MSTFETLPVILVSAANEAAASAFISELVDNDVTDEYMTGTHSGDRVWRLVNKYYTANVRVHGLADQGQLEVSPNAIEAHIIYIIEDECSAPCGGASVAAARAGGAGGAWRRAGVRLVCAAAAAAGALDAWACAQRAEAVALVEGEGEGAPAGPFAAERGVRAARAALHAHEWRGLQRTDGAAPPPADSAGEWSDEWRESDGSGGSDGSDGSGDSDADERRAVEHAEAFAAALGALGPARAAPPAQRRALAPGLLRAFCRALGLPPDAC